jgi:hypothetical protein
MAAAVPVAARVRELRTSRGLYAASAFHRGAVQEDDLVVVAGTVGREHSDQPLDRFGQACAALPVPGLLRELGEQVPQAFGCDREELPVVIQIHHRLPHGEGDDLRIGHASPGVLARFGQEIVSCAEHRCKQQVEVGEHRGPLGSTVIQSTVDFDLTAHIPYPTAPRAVESTI